MYACGLRVSEAVNLQFDGHIKKNPSENLEAPRKGFYLPKFLSRTEIESLLTVPDVSGEIGLRDKAILELMYACGLRVSEAVNLQFDGHIKKNPSENLEAPRKGFYLPKFLSRTEIESLLTVPELCRYRPKHPAQ